MNAFDTHRVACLGIDLLISSLRRNHTQEGELGAGPGHPGIFRSNRTYVDDPVCRAPNRRQENRPLNPEMAEGGRDGARTVERDRGATDELTPEDLVPFEPNDLPR